MRLYVGAEAREDVVKREAPGARVLRGRCPLRDGLRELVRGHPAVRGCDDPEDRLFSLAERPLDVAGEQGLERLLCLPLRVPVGEAAEVPQRSPGRGPPYWKSRVLRLKVLGDEDEGGGRGRGAGEEVA